MLSRHPDRAGRVFLQARWSGRGQPRQARHPQGHRAHEAERKRDEIADEQQRERGPEHAHERTSALPAGDEDGASLVGWFLQRRHWALPIR